MARNDTQIRVADFRLARDGEFGSVRLSPDIATEVDRVQKSSDKDDKRTKTHINRYFDEYCNAKDCRLNHEQFKKQGDFSDQSGGNVAVYVMKCYQWRLYGVQLHLNGKRCFVGLVCDPKKKQNKADQEALKKTARLAGQLTEYIELRGKRK